MAASAPRKANCTWAGLENASPTKMCAGSSSSKGAGMNTCIDCDPANASGMSATVLSIAGRKGRFDGSSCEALNFAGELPSASGSLQSKAIWSANRRQRSWSAASMREGWGALGESQPEAGGNVDQTSQQGNRGAHLRLEVGAISGSKDQPAKPRYANGRIQARAVFPTSLFRGALSPRSARHSPPSADGPQCLQ